MWNVEGKMMPPGQVMGYNLGRAGANGHLGNTDNQSLGSGFDDLHVEEYKKRNLEALNGNNVLRDPSLSLQNVNQIVNPSGNFISTSAGFSQSFGQSQSGCIQTDGALITQNSQLTQENRSISQLGSYSQYDISAKAGAGNSVLQSFPAREASSTSAAAVIEIPRLPYSQHFTYNVVGQSERSNSQSVTSTARYSENLQANYTSRGEMNTETLAPLFGDNLPLISSTGSSKESIQLSPEVNLRSENPDMQVHAQVLMETGRVSETAKSNNIFDVARSLNALLCQTNYIVSSIGSAERDRSCISSKNEIKPTSSMPVDACHQHHDPTRSGCAPSILTNSQAVSGTPSNHSIKMNDQVLLNNMAIYKDETSHGSMSTTGHIGFPITQSGVLDNQLKPILDGEPKTAIIGSNPMVTTGKIWDGMIQLNTSTTISAVAFFKSGERSLDISWPDFIEVKGKVRLEAFEKFIQELPRSRSRALMVTSMCWKVGTSETGLMGIKEVAKGYRDGQRVGFAHLCPGTDVYVCPRSETIITILAKYGFFKGMAAVEEDQDSLIGCVVWRRNSNPSTVSKDSESKKTPLDKSVNSPSNSNIQFAATNTMSLEAKDSENNPDPMPKINSAIALPAQASTGLSSCEGGGTAQNWMTSPSMILPSTGFKIAPVPVDPVNVHPTIPINSALPSTGNYFVSPLQNCTVQPQEAEAPILNNTCSKEPQINCSDSHPSFSGASWLPHGTRITSKCPDDDELPEFDFDIACGTLTSGCHVPWTGQQGSVGQGAKHPPLGDIETMSKPAMKSELPPMRASFAASPPQKYQGTQPHAKTASVDLERNTPVQTLEMVHNPSLSRENEAVVKQQVHSYSKRSMWDDDDMPEWCPPDLDLANQPPQPQPQALPSPPLPRLPLESDRQPRLPPSTSYPTSLLHCPPERDRQPRFLPPPALLPTPTMVSAPILRSPIRRQTLDASCRAQYTSNVAENNRVYGREPTSHNSFLPGQLPPAAPYFQSERRHSPVDSANSAGHPRGGFGMKHDRRPAELNYNEFSRRPHRIYEHEELSPRHKPSGTTRRRPTGFDVLPDGHRSTSPRRTKRRRSLFDVKPESLPPRGRR